MQPGITPNDHCTLTTNNINLVPSIHVSTIMHRTLPVHPAADSVTWLCTETAGPAKHTTFAKHGEGQEASKGKKQASKQAPHLPFSVNPEPHCRNQGVRPGSFSCVKIKEIRENFTRALALVRGGKAERVGVGRGKLLHF